MEAVSLVCQLFGVLVLAVNAEPYFWWGNIIAYNAPYTNKCRRLVREVALSVSMCFTLLAAKTISSISGKQEQTLEKT